MVNSFWDIKPTKLSTLNTKMMTTHDNYVIITIYEIRKTNEIGRKTGLKVGFVPSRDLERPVLYRLYMFETCFLGHFM